MARPITHGQSQGSGTYRSWRSMKSRCNLHSMPNYPNYGGRGIRYAQEWETFEGFLQDMGNRPEGTTLDRIDPEGMYCRDNCRWATASEQQRNKRKFAQPVGRTYGEANCIDCGEHFIKMSPIAKRCQPCVAYSRRYHKNG